MAATAFISDGLFDSVDTPSLTNAASASVSGSGSRPASTDGGMDIDAALAFGEADEDIFGNANADVVSYKSLPTRETRAYSASPPPQLDEEPEDWEEDMRAMEEAEAEEELARSRRQLANMASQASERSARAGGVESKGEQGDGGFGESDILSASLPDDDVNEYIRQLANGSEQSGAGPSSLRVYPIADRYEPKCLLPPLLAETADGRTLSIRRRFKPKARPLPDDQRPGMAGLNRPLLKLLKEVDELRNEQKAIELQRRYDEEQRNANGRASSSRSMWVDKYRPTKFSDLIGEDKVHREVLSWLKQWDQCVYKRIPAGKKRKAAEAEENLYQDALGRPRERVLLLSGPPGLGKTTLAQILARQAGYKMLEINASDDRNAATVTQRIKNAIDAGSGLGDGGRPVCVVIDEIDGATGGGDQSFIRSLVKLIQDVPANRKKNTPAKPLRRPIICICNDMYASSLRPLRPFARIVRFRKPAPQLLVRRLQDICAREGLVADLRVLTTLGDVTSGDIRSCLNTLQFIKSRSTTVTDDAIRSSAVGSKDSQTTMHNVWNALFVPLAAKVRRKNAGLRGAGGVDDGRYVDRLCAAIAGSSDIDRLVQGAFEHYPHLKPLDASLNNLCRLLDGPLHFYDAVSKRTGGGEYDVMSYAVYGVVPWYTHMAAPANSAKPVEWPKADYEAFLTRTTNEEVATQMKAGLPPILRSLFCGQTSMTELVPLLMRIITPPLKPVNANIVKPAEKALLTRLVELMIPLGLSFWVEKAENGQPMMRLEPPIDCFVHYDGKRADDVAAGRFAVRQLVAQAMDAEVARRRGAAGQQAAGETRDTLAGMYGAVKKGQRMQAPAKETVVAAATDFFGRAIVKKPAVTAVMGDTGTADATHGAEAMPVDELPVIKKFRAVYKFHEGSSAAVRKGVKMSTLM